MTESSEDRSKRKFNNYLLNYEWNYQISIFYRDYQESLNAIDHSRKIRKRIIRKYPDQAFLWRLSLGKTDSENVYNHSENDNKEVDMIYHTFFTNKDLRSEDFQKFIGAILGLDAEEDLYIKRRRVSDWKPKQYAKAVKLGKPFDLSKYLSTNDKINRFSLLNRDLASQRMDED